MIAAAVRLLGLGNQDLWGDEAFSVMTAIGPVQNLLGALATGEPHPPLYPLLLAVWLRAFGHSELVARLPSAFASVASVAVAMALARAFAGADTRSAARGMIVAGLLVALNPFQVWYAQEARMYAQVGLFAGLATLALLRLRRGRRGAVAAYAIAVVGVAGSHYYGLFVPLAHGLAILAIPRARPGIARRWLVAVALATLAYLPWVVYAWHVFAGYYGALPGSVNLVGIAAQAWVRVAAGWSVSWPLAVATAVVVTALALSGLAAPARSDEDRFLRSILVFWLATPYVAGFLISLVRPMYAERYFAVSSLPLILLVARGINRQLAGLEAWHSLRLPDFLAGERLALPGMPSALLRHLVASRLRRGKGSPSRPGTDPTPALPVHGEGANRTPPAPVGFPPRAGGQGGGRLRAGSMPGPRAVVGVAALAVALIVALGPLYNLAAGRYVKSTYNTHARDVAALAAPGDAVILDGTSQMPLYSYYVANPPPTYPLPRTVPLDPVATDRELGQIAARQRGVWILLYATVDYDPGYFVPSWLATHAYQAFDDWAVSGRLQYYRFATDPQLTFRQTRLSFGSSLVLDRYGFLGDDIAAGDALPIDLQWTRLGAAIPHPRVGLRLVDQAGFTWAQNDQPLGGDFGPAAVWQAGSAFDDRHGIFVPPGTPPGDYQLLLGVYSADDLRPLAIAGEGASVGPSGVLLATVHVTRPSQGAWTAGLAGYHSVGKAIGNALELVGAAGSDRATTGSSGYLTVVWKALADHPDAPKLRLAILRQDGKLAQQRDVALATSGYPPDRWRAGDVLREQYRLPVSDRLSAGSYRLAVVPLGPTGQPLLTEPLDLGPLAVAAGAARPRDAPAQHPLDVALGGAVALTGFDLGSASAKPGATVDLALHWKDLAPLDADYTVFVHVLDSSERVVAQRDQPPAAGQRPTSSWFVGDTIVDDYHLTLPPTLPPGRYPVEVGMYLPSTGARLPVAVDGRPAGDRIILATLDVGP